MSLERIVSALSAVPGVLAVALGGSRARGEATPTSDTDIGIYYRAAALDIPALDRAATTLDDEHRAALINPPGAWGPWVNGGGWLTIDDGPVDILLRDADRVETVLNDCASGRITIDYQAGHPFGFVNAIYAAEITAAKLLWQDADGTLDRLKAILGATYPEMMRTGMTEKFMWEAAFSAACMRKAALRGDVNYACGSLFRTACAWAQVVYALNGKYLMNEKGALSHIDALPLAPQSMRARIERAYQQIVGGEVEAALLEIDALHGEIEGLLT